MGVYEQFSILTDWLSTDLIATPPTLSDQNTLNISLLSGEYAVAVVPTTNISLFPTTKLTLTGPVESYDEVKITAEQSGNVIDDVDSTDGKDETTLNTVVKSVNGLVLADNLTETLPNTTTAAAKISGLYGDLYISADGSYVYILDSARTGKEQLGLAQEIFTYRLVDTVTGEWSTANLSFNLDSVYAVNDVNDAGHVVSNVVIDNKDFMTSITNAGASGSAGNYSYTAPTFNFTIANDKVGENLKLNIAGKYASITSQAGTYTLTYSLKKDGVEILGAVDKEFTDTADFVLSESLTNLTSGNYSLDVSITKAVTTGAIRNADFDVSISLKGKEIDLDNFTNTLKTIDGEILVDDILGNTGNTYFEIKGKFDVNPHILYQSANLGEASRIIQGEHGVLTIRKDGSYDYTPNGTTYGQDTFEYTLYSPVGNSSDATLTINVAKDFTGSSFNDIVKGGTVGIDTYFMGTGADTVVFSMLVGAETDDTGGNGHDTWTDFSLTEGDRIDVNALLQDGLSKLATDSNYVGNYIKVNTSGNDTVIRIDRDGSATDSTYTETELLTLKNVNTTLQELLDNNQLLF